MAIFDLNNNMPLNPKLKVYDGDLWLPRYDHPLPKGLKTIKGNVVLEGYAHPLPKGLEIIDGWLWLYGYDQPLPEGLTVKGKVVVGNYDVTRHGLPEQLAVKVFQQWAEERQRR